MHIAQKYKEIHSSLSDYLIEDVHKIAINLVEVDLGIAIVEGKEDKKNILKNIIESLKNPKKEMDMTIDF